VASVKPSGSGPYSNYDGGPGTKDPGRFTATGASLRGLVVIAYRIRSDQFSGPAWMETERFDVTAKIPPGATEEQFRRMLQNLLAERFQMQVHHETRTVPVYELVVAKNGPRLKPAEQGSGADGFVPGEPWPVDRDGFPILPRGRPGAVGGSGPGGVHWTFRMQTVKSLAEVLSGPVGAGWRVIDKTGLSGKYDFTLYYRPVNGPPPGPDDDAPSIEQAVQEQLGLKLVPSKAPIDVVVVDRAEKAPSEN
jgi:uncharacterized protein (TIGR03435 family)